MKKCTKCHKTKDESEYWSRGYRKRSGKKRLYSYCNVCAREAERLYRANNPDKVRQYDKNRKTYRNKQSLERKAKYHRAYLQKNIDSLGDPYIKFLLTVNTPLKYEDLTEDMIKAQRASLQLKRALGLTNYKKETK
tara:strand:+ start:1134 stop:1541 length:408 start_codon:yes stop_codon:yes gene_type:complete